VRTAREMLWKAGAPVRIALVGAVHVYRLTAAGWLGGQCRFSPSCSGYAVEAIRTRGALVGTVLAVWRVLRCNPFGVGGPDPVPVQSRVSKSYAPLDGPRTQV
jgi:uncharacterized protein